MTLCLVERGSHRQFLTLADARVKSVLVELNTNLAEHRAVIPDLEKLGFHYSPDQVSKSIRTAGAFTGVGNHVFRR